MAKAKLTRIPAREERQPDRSPVSRKMLLRSVRMLSRWLGDVKMGTMWRIGSRLNENFNKQRMPRLDKTSPRQRRIRLPK